MAPSILLSIGTDLGDINNVAWIASGWAVTSSVGCCVAGRVSDIFGRRYVILAGEGIGIVGAVSVHSHLFSSIKLKLKSCLPGIKLDRYWGRIQSPNRNRRIRPFGGRHWADPDSLGRHSRTGTFQVQVSSSTYPGGKALTYHCFRAQGSELGFHRT